MQKITYFLSFALLLLLNNPLMAQVDDPEDSFSALRSLNGVWFMPTDRGDRLEIWKIIDDTTMTGRGLRIKPENGDTVVLETMRLTLRDTAVIYSVTVRGQNKNKPIDFRLTRDDEQGFLFENPAHDDPKKILYFLLSNREIQVKTEGQRNGRTVSDEFVFEREFNPASTEFRLRGGINMASLQAERNLNGIVPSPSFGWRPGWELGAQTLFKGSGGFLAINVEAGFSSKSSGVLAQFAADTVLYKRDGYYRSFWFNAAAYPEFKLKRDGRLSVVVGPYAARRLFLRAYGDNMPESDTNVFSSVNDWRKTDFGILAGLEYRLPVRKRDLGSKIGIRFNYGLTDLDNLYRRRCGPNSALCNERILLRSASVAYSLNLLKI